MNSLRTDIEFYTRNGRKEALHPLPVYERPSDNEYEWKDSPFRLDGWLSRIVTVLEVSPHDPYVRFAADANGWAYQSNTRGEIWHQMDDLKGVRDLLFSPDYPWLAFAAGTHGIYRTLDGGQTWSQTFDRPIERLFVDPENTHILFAVGPEGIYKSSDFGEYVVGTGWQLISGEVPSVTKRAFAIDPRGDREKMYLLTSQGVYRKQYGDPDWTPPPRVVRKRGFSDLRMFPGKPLWIRVDETVPNRLFFAQSISEAGYTGVLISFSEDDGRTWKPIVRDLQPLFDWLQDEKAVGQLTEKDLIKLFAILKEWTIEDIRMDANDPATWYGRMQDGIAVTHNAGLTWSKSQKGLDIPRVGALWTPRHSGDVYVGTPAGMYVSHDRGASWEDTSLILQEGGALRAEIGGVGYLEAYWMGRYHGFISDEEASRRWWK